MAAEERAVERVMLPAAAGACSLCKKEGNMGRWSGGRGRPCRRRALGRPVRAVVDRLPQLLPRPCRPPRPMVIHHRTAGTLCREARELFELILL